MQILGLLGMYFDAVVVKVETFLLLFRFALALLWHVYFLFLKDCLHCIADLKGANRYICPLKKVPLTSSVSKHEKSLFEQG